MSVLIGEEDEEDEDKMLLFTGEDVVVVVSVFLNIISRRAMDRITPKTIKPMPILALLDKAMCCLYIYFF